jgi:hypothetical protein
LVRLGGSKAETQKEGMPVPQPKNARFRIYRNGKLCQSNACDVERGQKWLDNAQQQWEKHAGGPIVGPGEFDPNNAHTVTRVDQNTLEVTTTGGHKLRFVVVTREVIA